MKYSTGRKGRSKLQGHRKRRRSPALSLEESNAKLSWTEYKTIRQYQTMGEILDSLMMVGYHGTTDDHSLIFQDHKHSTSNGYFWLTRDPP
jgi:hypothetical protein